VIDSRLEPAAQFKYDPTAWRKPSRRETEMPAPVRWFSKEDVTDKNLKLIADPSAGLTIFFGLDLIMVQIMGLFSDGGHQGFYGVKVGLGLRPPRGHPGPNDDQVYNLGPGGVMYVFMMAAITPNIILLQSLARGLPKTRRTPWIA